MSFSIGANDASNGLATSYGSGALSLSKLVICGAIAEFIGAFFCSEQVSTSLGTGVILNLSTFSDEI